MFKKGKRSDVAENGKHSKKRSYVIQDSSVIDEFAVSDDVETLSTDVPQSKASVCVSGNSADVRDDVDIVSSVAIGSESSMRQSRTQIADEGPSPSGKNRDRFMLQNAHGQVLDSAVAAVPSFPGSNRARFMANCQPLKVCCDLSAVGMHNTGSRFSFQAVVLIVYPASVKPERRHIQLIDSHGSTGLTVWNDHVSLFSQSSVGQVVRFTKLAVVHQNGQKSLTMGRDSTICIMPDTVSPTDESKWWKSLLEKPPIRIIDAHDCEDNTIINISGIVGSLYSETKRVRSEDRELLCMRITDRSGFIDVRSWNHSEVEFAQFKERPIQFKRVRVTSFAGTKILELLDASGTEVHSVFDGKTDLESYWIE